MLFRRGPVARVRLASLGSPRRRDRHVLRRRRAARTTGSATTTTTGERNVDYEGVHDWYGLADKPDPIRSSPYITSAGTVRVRADSDLHACPPTMCWSATTRPRSIRTVGSTRGRPASRAANTAHLPGRRGRYVVSSPVTQELGGKPDDRHREGCKTDRRQVGTLDGAYLRSWVIVTCSKKLLQNWRLLHRCGIQPGRLAPAKANCAACPDSVRRANKRPTRQPCPRPWGSRLAVPEERGSRADHEQADQDDPRPRSATAPVMTT